MLLKISLLVFIGTSSALQCHECLGKKEDIKNPRLEEKWQDFAATSDYLKYDSICSHKEDLGQISTCPSSHGHCAYIEFKDEEMKEKSGKH